MARATPFRSNFWRAAGLATAGLAIASACTAAPRDLTDADLRAYAASKFDAAAMMEKHVVVGRYHGAAVVAEFPCSDICPQYTTRIIYLDVKGGPACGAANGVYVTRRVPYSIAMINKDFCVPQPIAAGR